VGDPFAAGVEQGPQVSREQLDRILHYINVGQKEGAKLAAGGARIGDKGYYVQPTVFHDVEDHHTVSSCGGGSGGGRATDVCHGLSISVGLFSTILPPWILWVALGPLSFRWQGSRSCSRSTTQRPLVSPAPLAGQIAREEIFGPVMSIIKWRTMDEIVYRANNTLFGLAAGVWTKDVDRALYLSRALKAGTVWVS
jgi:acyl-CoA reductase-like NAD-dependent aldehyde dehydrogenase